MLGCGDNSNCDKSSVAVQMPRQGVDPGTNQCREPPSLRGVHPWELNHVPLGSQVHPHLQGDHIQVSVSSNDAAFEGPPVAFVLIVHHHLRGGASVLVTKQSGAVRSKDGTRGTFAHARRYNPAGRPPRMPSCWAITDRLQRTVFSCPSSHVS